MEILYDLHTHTIASGHAYSTLKENIEAAYERGLKGYGFSDHSEGVRGSVKNIYFMNFKVIPRDYKGMRIFAGVEANIIDYNGKLDIENNILKRLDYVIASMHTLCIEPGSLDENMNAYIGAMKNEYVKIIGHPDDSRYEIDYETLVKQAIENEVVLELNNSSLNPNSARKNGRENIITLLNTCKKYGASIICNTDSHISYDVGNFDDTIKLLKELSFPKELVVNSCEENLYKVLNISI